MHESTSGRRVRCERCGRVRPGIWQEWTDHPAKLPGEVLGFCRTCGDILAMLRKRKTAREDRRLIWQREKGFGPGTGDAFAGMREKGEEMKIGAAFPGQYLKAADLQGRRVQVTVERVEMEDIGGDQKPVVHFKGKERGLVLNKTNSNAIWGITGTDETDEWTGTVIVLYPSKTDFQGKQVDCIRIDGSQPQPKKKPQPKATATVDLNPVDDDEVPF